MPPATEPAVQQVLDGIETWLGGIAAGALFYTTIEHTSQSADFEEDLPGYPALQLGSISQDENDVESQKHVEVDLSLRVWLHLRQWEDKTRDVERFIADVQRRVRTDASGDPDHTLGGTVRDAHITKVVRWEYRGDRPVAGAYLDLQVEFRYLREDPFTVSN